MTALLIIGALLILFLAVRAAGASARPVAAPRPRHDAPLDPIIDPGLDPLIAPWAEAPLLRRPPDALAIAEDDFTPAGGDFGGGGASGDWDDDSQTDDGGDSSDDD